MSAAHTRRSLSPVSPDAIDSLMQFRNLFLFIVLSSGVMIGWQQFVLKPQQLAREKARKAQQPAADTEVAKAAAAVPKVSDEKPVEAAKPGEAKKPDQIAPAKPAEPLVLPPIPKTFPLEIVRLGSPNADSPYFLDVELTSKGAAVNSIGLNDSRYKDLKDRDKELKVVGNNTSKHRTFDMTIPEIDLELKKTGLALSEVNWELISTTDDKDIPGVKSAATFRFETPDGVLAIFKHYSVSKSAAASGAELAEARESEPKPYMLDFRIEIQNRGKEAETVKYLLQGPTGLPLENADNTSKFRDLKMGFLNEDGTLHASSKRADALVKEHTNGELEEWRTPFKFVGVDVQYFAALVIPSENQLQTQYVEVVKPVLIDAPVKAAFTDISLQFESKPIELAAGEKSVEHKYELYAGPKRKTLLEPLEATSVLDFGFAAKISNVLLWVLRFQHDLGLPYGLAIIGLTILVRSLMFPLSRKQAAGAKRMKDLQPKIQELKKKFGEDREKFARAQMELFRENNYNPLSGCFPVLIQLPIFIGLYQALNNAVDLRMAPFLWIDNLAAPDALFRLPFRIPYLGQDFNLLPLITVALFVVQQKMFMPPPADEQQEMQFKMMNVMMIFMGAMFYHVAAGLCVYFIASSLWGMGERKLLDWTHRNDPPPSAQVDAPPGKTDTKKAETSRPGIASSLWSKLLETADNAGSQTALRNEEETRTNGKKKDKKTKPRK